MSLFGCLAILFLCAACATPIRSTVDAYGEDPLIWTTPLFFDRSGLPLADRPVSDACRDAARDLKLTIVETDCADCRRVEVHPRLTGTTQAVESSGPAFNTSVGFFGGPPGWGLGVGSGNTASHPETERVIDLLIFSKRKLVRAVTARSVGVKNSVAAVAYEMCTAALQDFPANLKGKIYEVKAKD